MISNNLPIVPTLNNNPPLLRQLLRDKILLKKKLGEILIKQFIEFQVKGVGHFSRTCAAKTVYFHGKTKIFIQISSESFITAKNIAGGNVPRYSPPGPSYV